MAHITLQTGTAHEEKVCPNLQCVFNTGAALSTANFHFMDAVVRQYPHILKRIYMPAEYAAIVSPEFLPLPMPRQSQLNFQLGSKSISHTLPRTAVRHPSSLPLDPMLLLI